MAVALKDLAGLMDKARDMVSLAERLRSSIQKGGSDGCEIQEFEAVALDMGIASPITRQSAGAVYHQQLARQLADFLVEPLRHAGGMVTLPDVYCIFNRARGAELVSPDDVLKVCKLWPTLGISLCLRRFDSGLTVVHDAGYSDEQTCARLGTLAYQSEGGITVADVARLCAVTLAVAREYLTIAEGRCVLCRDEGPEGVSYFDATPFSGSATTTGC